MLKRLLLLVATAALAVGLVGSPADAEKAPPITLGGITSPATRTLQAGIVVEVGAVTVDRHYELSSLSVALEQPSSGISGTATLAVTSWPGGEVLVIASCCGFDLAEVNVTVEACATHVRKGTVVCVAETFPAVPLVVAPTS